MGYQSVFKRYEMKYIITKKQKMKLVESLQEHLVMDQYGRTRINSIYFDTPDYRLIRQSIDKPSYKEKLRLRSYGETTSNSPVYVELKKKYDHVVYKRRIGTTEKNAMRYLCKHADVIEQSQIKNEIDYVKSYYKDLQPMVFLSYEREAYTGVRDAELRVTFDDQIFYRNEEVCLTKGAWGERILGANEVLMEIKTPTAVPLWFTEFLSENKIYKQSFSKYGTAYKHMMEEKSQGGAKYA